jgi:enoyl-CoA hydratase/carnithine racemase
MESTTGHIRYEVDGDGIGVLTIDRPEKRGAMTYAMLFEFIGTVREAAADDACRVLIVTGAGGSFCAGTDLADLATVPGESRGVRGEAEEHDVWWPLTAVPKPTIAAVDGAAVGMGTEFATQCDVRICSDRARFAWNFGHRGLVPDTGAGTWLLPRIVGMPQALRLLYSGEMVDAATAKELGYVSEVVAADALHERAMAIARTFLQTSPMSNRLTKQLVLEGLSRDVGEHMAHHVEALKTCFASDDHREGVAAFLERRPAHFTGK